MKKFIPAVPFHKELLPEDETARNRLATWVTHKDNQPFSRAIVNRMWNYLFGKPLVAPVDNIPLNEEELPAMLIILSKDFAEHDFNLQRLIRVIANTKAFQLSGKLDTEKTELHQEQWAVFPLTRLRPEQVVGALIQSCWLQTIDYDSHITTRTMRWLQQNEFIKRYGDAGEFELEDAGGTIPQRLLMMNGKLLHSKTKDEFFNACGRISSLTSNNKVAIEIIYMTVLSRRPTEPELSHFINKLENTKDLSRGKIIQDIYWALLNSTEFSWNH